MAGPRRHLGGQFTTKSHSEHGIDQQVCDDRFSKPPHIPACGPPGEVGGGRLDRTRLAERHDSHPGATFGEVASGYISVTPVVASAGQDRDPGAIGRPQGDGYRPEEAESEPFPGRAVHVDDATPPVQDHDPLCTSRGSSPRRHRHHQGGIVGVGDRDEHFGDSEALRPGQSGARQVHPRSTATGDLDVGPPEPAPPGAHSWSVKQRRLNDSPYLLSK